MAIARPGRDLGKLAPLVAAALVFGDAHWSTIAFNAACIALIMLFGLARWQSTRFRVTDQHLEIRFGVLIKNHLQIPRDRIRGVTLTHEFTYRVLGLAIVRVAGSQQGVTLDGLPVAEARRLQRVLLARPSGTATGTRTTPVDLATLDKRWLRFAPFTLAGWVAVSGLCSAIISVADNLGATAATVTDGTKAWVTGHPLWMTVSLVTAAALLVVVVGSLVVYLLRFWDFRLTREHGDMLRVRRGLLTTRSASVTEARLRGVETIEQLPLRAVRGAAANALIAGMSVAGTRMTLLPPAPIQEAQRVCALALRTPASPTATPLRRHPRAALQRRMTRAIAPAMLLAAALTVYAPPWAWVTAWALVPALTIVAWDRYRSLGHALTSRFLVTRNGSLLRRTVALQTSGIAGWRISQSWTQRRAGLLTVSATTAAAAGLYSVVDIDADDGLRLAAQAVPDLLDDLLDDPGAHEPTLGANNGTTGRRTPTRRRSRLLRGLLAGAGRLLDFSASSLSARRTRSPEELADRVRRVRKRASSHGRPDDGEPTN